jgi:hypothetical protein
MRLGDRLGRADYLLPWRRKDTTSCQPMRQIACRGTPYPRSEDSSGGCLFASFRKPWMYCSSTRRRSYFMVSKHSWIPNCQEAPTCSQSAICVFTRSTWVMRSLRTFTACAGERVVYTRRERKPVGGRVSSSLAMLGILCVGAPWRDYGRTAHSHSIAGRYVYMESRSR